MIRSLEGQFLQFIVFYCYKQLLLKLVDIGNLLANPKLGGGGEEAEILDLVYSGYCY